MDLLLCTFFSIDIVRSRLHFLTICMQLLQDAGVF